MKGPIARRRSECSLAGELYLQEGMDVLTEHGGRTSKQVQGRWGSCYHSEDLLTPDLEISTEFLARVPQSPESREEEPNALWPLVTFAFSTLYLNYLSFYFFFL